MSDLDVSFRLRLINDLSKEAKRAEDDLKKLDKAVDRLGKGGRTNLDRNLEGLSKKAREGVSAVKSLESEVKKLDGLNTKKLDAEIKSVATTSKVVGRTIGDVLKRAKQDVANFNTEPAQQKMRELAATSKFAGRTIGEVIAEAKAKVNTIKTDQSEAEIKALGTAARTAMENVEAMQRKHATTFGGMQRLTEIEKPANRLNGVMATLGSNATTAFAGLAAFASVDNIIRGLDRMAEKARELQREVANVAVTAEMRNPETVEKLGASNRKLGIKYGLDQLKINEARKTFAAAGIDIDSQEALLDPTVKTSKAEDSDPNDVAASVIAAKQNLGLKDQDVAAYLDQMAKGTKLGSFEVGAMARNFPKLAALYQQTGRGGLDATSELIAFSQIVRKTAGTEDQAATNLENILSKIFAPDAQKNFKEKGVDLSKIRDRALANNEPYLMSVVDEVMKITGGDTFKVSELFGDLQAKQALSAIMANRKLYDDWQNQIRNNSGGTVDADYDFLKNLPAERADRRDQALDATGQDLGTRFYNFIEPLLDKIARTANAEFENQRRNEEMPAELRDNALRRHELETRKLELQSQQRQRDRPAPDVEAKITAIEAAIRRLKAEETDILGEQRRRNPDRYATSPDGGDLGKATGKIPIPVDRPVEAAIGKDMSGAAEQSMNGYNDALRAAGNQAISIGQDIAAKLKSMLSFTATPTISPNMVNPGSSTAKVPGKQSSLTSATPTKVTQNITTPSAQRAARLAIREQDRATRMARARAYADMGSMPA